MNTPRPIRFRNVAGLLLLLWPLHTPAAAQRPLARVEVPAGSFAMGAAPPAYAGEPDAGVEVEVARFWLTSTEITNRQFAAFVRDTGYLTTAERPVGPASLGLDPSAAALAPGSIVFTGSAGAVPLDDPARWWRWTPGASWRRPEGPGSDLAGRWDHPVVHVSHADAAAFCAWAGGRLPTEAEWERAARFGRDGARFVWGDTFEPHGAPLANVWQGAFPHRDEARDGHAGTAPVASFPPSALGLFDMAGNVWEWTADREGPDPAAGCCATGAAPAARELAVLKGGSYLCHASYCEAYRPAARMRTTPDSSLGHLGFRCAFDRPVGAGPGPDPAQALGPTR